MTTDITLGNLTVHRLGYGTMRLVGDGAWGEPSSREDAHKVLRRAIDLGINFLDTADAYGPEIAEELIAEALYPYPKDLVIATKGGITRQGPAKAAPVGRPEYLHQCVEMSLRRLRLETLPLYQLHRIDAQVPMEDSLGKLVELREQGKLQHIGLSEVTVEELQQALKITPIVSVQNKYNLTERKHEAVVSYCTKQGIAFLPWYPIAAGKLAKPGSHLDDYARDLSESRETPGGKPLTVSQLCLGWLLQRSPMILPIPGTFSIQHLEENAAAMEIDLAEDDWDNLELIIDGQSM